MYLSMDVEIGGRKERLTTLNTTMSFDPVVTINVFPVLSFRFILMSTVLTCPGFELTIGYIQCTFSGWSIQ